MERQNYLIDTNIIIDYLGAKFPNELILNFVSRVINEIPNISVISEIELLGYDTAHSDSVLLTDFVADSNFFGLSTEVVSETIKIRKEFKIKLPDSIIAATAIVNNLTLLTRNISDFKKISTLKLINPYDIPPFDPFSIPLF